MKQHPLFVDDPTIVDRFVAIRRTLTEERSNERLQHPLQDWVLPCDRNLPLALLDRTVADILDTPLAELAETRGVGEKKFRALLQLLTRAAKEQPCVTPPDNDCQASDGVETENSTPRSCRRFSGPAGGPPLDSIAPVTCGSAESHPNFKRFPE